MAIRLQSLRIKGFRGFRNIEIDFENTTVLVGTNNSGKTTILKALQIALTNTHFISNCRNSRGSNRVGLFATFLNGNINKILRILIFCFLY